MGHDFWFGVAAAYAAEFVLLVAVVIVVVAVVLKPKRAIKKRLKAKNND